MDAGYAPDAGLTGAAATPCYGVCGATTWQHRGRLLLMLVLTGAMAGLTALYPVVIDRAFSMFAARDAASCTRCPCWW